MRFLNISKDLDDLTLTERSFHNLAPLYEKHFWPKTDLRRGTAKSVLVLWSSLLQIGQPGEHFYKINASLVVYRFIHHLQGFWFDKFSDGGPTKLVFWLWVEQKHHKHCLWPCLWCFYSTHNQKTNLVGPPSLNLSNGYRFHTHTVVGLD